MFYNQVPVLHISLVHIFIIFTLPSFILLFWKIKSFHNRHHSHADFSNNCCIMAMNCVKRHSMRGLVMLRWQCVWLDHVQPRRLWNPRLCSENRVNCVSSSTTALTTAIPQPLQNMMLHLSQDTEKWQRFHLSSSPSQSFLMSLYE